MEIKYIMIEDEIFHDNVGTEVTDSDIETFIQLNGLKNAEGKEITKDESEKLLVDGDDSIIFINKDGEEVDIFDDFSVYMYEMAISRGNYDRESYFTYNQEYFE